jgi:ABC-type nitrate/sulfonate/bicarbonate transport system substrate-binding protein
MTMRRLRVNVFPGIQNLPHFAAIQQGCFAARGLDVAMAYTTSSEAQREALATGACDIAHAAVDNAVAMVDVAREDIVIVVGLDPSFNKFVVQSEIGSYADLRGKILGVDAPDTAFALIAYDILARKGLPRGSYRVEPIGATRFRLEAMQQRRIDAAMLNLPFNLMARASGLKFLDDPLSIIGSYQSVGGFVRRDWASAHASTLVGYLAAYIEGVRWVLDRGNRLAGAALLAQEMKLSPEMADECMSALTHAGRGIARDAAFDVAGMETVLKLRAGFVGGPGAAPAPVSRYYDSTFHDAALAMLAEAKT